MKVEIQQEDIQQVLHLVASVVPSKTTMPILTCLLMETQEGQLKVSATNLDISVVTTTDKGKITKDGRVAVPAAKFTTFIRNLPPGKIKIEERKGKVSVVAGKASLEEPCMNVEEFPALPPLADKKALEVEAATLAEMIRSSAYCVSRDETRPALMGVLWEVRPDSLRLIATDAHRLARSHQKMAWDTPKERDMIVDTQILQLVRLCDGEEKVDLHMGENQLSFRVGSTVLHSRLLEGPFPDYRAVIPKDNDKNLTLDREIFAQAIRRVSITADRITNQIRLGIEAGSMELSATGTDGSHAEDQIPVSYEGDALDIGFNFSYLQEILKNLQTDNVQLSIKDPQSAALIKPVEADKESGVLCLLMPLRLTSD